MKSCLIIAGEQSGEEHCLSFLPDLRKQDQDICFFGVGGEGMEKAGVDLLYHLKEFSTWGISGVFSRIPFYRKAMKKILAEVQKRNCKVAILIDFQTFNLLLAKELYKLGVKVQYYVAPQAWAWKEWRTKSLSRYVDTLYTIIPFEKKWFMSRGVRQVRSIEHPLKIKHREGLKVDQKRRRDFASWENSELKILLLPGSRLFEVESLMPEFLEAIKLLKKNYKKSKIELGIVRADSIDNDIFNKYAEVFHQTFSSDCLEEALKWADFAMAASGTVTLSAGLFRLPTVVCYKGSLLNEFIFENLISYDGPISLVNIVHGEKLFPELIQNQASGFNIFQKLRTWMNSKSTYEQLISKLSQTPELLSGEVDNIPEFLRDKISSSYQGCVL